MDVLVFPPVKLSESEPDDGLIPGRISLVMYLYFKEQRALPQRLAMIEIIHEIRALVGEGNWGWWASEATGRMYFDRKKKFDLSKQEQHLINPNRFFAIAMSSVDAGGDSPEDVSKNAQRFYVQFLADETNEDVGKMRLYVPTRWALGLTSDNSMTALFARWSQKLNALHGVLGLGIGLSDNKLARSDRSYYFDLAKAVKQSPGLICEQPGVLPMAKGMSSINWQTYVRDEWLERIGGRQAVKDRCRSPVLAIDLPQGLLVQAGPGPEIQPDKLESYKKVAAIFKPLRAQAVRDKHVVMEISTPENAMDSDLLRRDSEAYLARFD